MVPNTVPGVVRDSVHRRGVHVQAFGLAGDLGQSKVEDLRVPAFGDEDVRGLDVAMHDSSRMSGVECVRDFDGERQEDCFLQGTTGDAVRQGHAVQKLHGDEGMAVLFANVVDGADIGMVQGGSGLGFALKTSESVGIAGNVFGQELESNEAVKAGVFGFVNHAHAATAELLDDAVVRNGLADHGAGTVPYGRAGGRGSQSQDSLDSFGVLCHSRSGSGLCHTTSWR